MVKNARSKRIIISFTFNWPTNYQLYFLQKMVKFMSSHKFKKLNYNFKLEYHNKIIKFILNIPIRFKKNDKIELWFNKNIYHNFVYFITKKELFISNYLNVCFFNISR